VGHNNAHWKRLFSNRKMASFPEEAYRKAWRDHEAGISTSELCARFGGVDRHFLYNIWSRLGMTVVPALDDPHANPGMYLRGGTGRGNRLQRLFAWNLMKFRRQRGYGQSELSARLGWSMYRCANLEKLLTLPTTPDMDALCTLFGKSEEDFLRPCSCFEDIEAMSDPTATGEKMLTADHPGHELRGNELRIEEDSGLPRPGWARKQEGNGPQCV